MRGPKPKYPLREMAVNETRVIAHSSKSFRWYVHKHGATYGKRFTTHRVEGGMEVTRVA